MTQDPGMVGGGPVPQPPTFDPPSAPPAAPQSLFDRNLLVVNQKAKLIEVTNEYAILDEHGGRIGAVRQVGQSALRKMLRMVSSIDPLMTQHLEVADATGRVVLQITKPRAFLRPRVVVSRPNAPEVGQIGYKLRIGKPKFVLSDPAGNELGTVSAENWRAWDFRVDDASGREVARITKKWAGFGKELFTTADNYVIQVDPSLRDPLRTLAIASGLAVDTVLKQNQ
jgi:uncharacterized protein YxjI